jgi:hypothetical protein
VPSPRPSHDALAEYSDHNPLVIAGLVRDRFPSRQAFAEAIRRSSTARDRSEGFTTISSVLDGLRPVRPPHEPDTARSGQPVRGRSVAPALFFTESGDPRGRQHNFDAIFRLYVTVRMAVGDPSTIERASAQTDPAWLKRFPKRISVYHVHG